MSRSSAFLPLLPAVMLLASCGGRGADPARGPSATSPAGAAVSPSHIDGARALEEVRRFVEIRPRDAGTDGARRAAEYIASALRGRGLVAGIDEFQDRTPSGTNVFRNVTAMAGPGDGPLVVLVSHFDTKSGISGDFQGANDSGSSTGLLLELATVLAENPPARLGVLLAFLDGEECVRAYGGNDGLHGSRRLAGRLLEDGRSRRVRAVVVLDMVGDRDLNVALPRNGDGPLAAAIFKAASAEGVRSKFSLADGGVTDDHVPFIEAGMPAADIIDFEYGSKPGANDYWHTDQDSMDKLSADSLSAVGRVVMRLLATMDGT